MQISENTDFGLRVAVMRLQRDENAPAFTLYPMIHLGERRLYETVRDEFRSHDLLICEGASGRAVRRLAQVYLQAARNRRSDLVLQNSVLGIRDLAIPYRIADLPAEELDRLWAKVPFWERWAMELGALAYGLLWRYYGGSFAMQKLTPVEDRQEGFFDDLPGYDALQEAWDAVLVAALDKAVAEGPRRVAVLYGAYHMRAVIRCLMGTHGYRIANARWLTVVTY
jgi:hypothetical protein